MLRVALLLARTQALIIEIYCTSLRFCCLAIADAYRFGGLRGGLDLLRLRHTMGLVLAGFRGLLSGIIAN